MRNKLSLILAGAVVALALMSILRLPGALAQEPPKENETVAAPPKHSTLPDASHLWNFYWSGKARKGDVIELAQLDSAANAGKALVITHMEFRLRPSMRMELHEYRKDGEKKGNAQWKKVVRRGEGFSAGYADSTTQWVVVYYDSNTGTLFEPDTRPSLETTFGTGDIEVWAEGYWATAAQAGK